MAESSSKKRSPRFPLIDDPREWIWFDWEHQIIVRHLERSVAKSIEFSMPDEFEIENGCIVRRLDTGEIIDHPLSVDRFTVGAKLVYFDDFANTKKLRQFDRKTERMSAGGLYLRDDRTIVYVGCEVIPAKRIAKPRTQPTKLSPLTNPATERKNEKAKGGSVKKSGLLF